MWSMTITFILLPGISAPLYTMRPPFRLIKLPPPTFFSVSRAACAYLASCSSYLVNACVFATVVTLLFLVSRYWVKYFQDLRSPTAPQVCRHFQAGRHPLPPTAHVAAASVVQSGRVRCCPAAGGNYSRPAHNPRS